MNETGAIYNFLKRARQRRMLMMALDQMAIAATAGLVCAILLLITGTQFLDWYWPVLLFAAALSVLVLRLRKRLPSVYGVAHEIDARLGLHDALSTAHYFQGADRRLVGLQRGQAEALIRNIRPEQAIPFSTPQSAYFCAAGLLAAGLLFGVRYGLTQSLSLKKPIADIRWSPGTPTRPVERLASRKSVLQERMDEQLAQMGMTLEKIDSPPGDLSDITDKAMPAFATPEGKAPMSAPDKNVSGGEKSAAEGGENESGEQAQSGSEQSQQDSGADAKAPNMAKAQQGQSDSKNGSQGSQGENSLGSKLKDALNQLMAKLKPSQGQGDQQQQQASSQQGQQGRPQSQKGPNQGQGKSQGEGQPPKDGQNAQNGEGGEQSQSTQSKAGDRNSDRAGQEDAKSGVGKQDGAKEIREAEQLAAMGKISELIGKRSQQLTGEMTVEVSSGNQQLKTGYTQRSASHADLGAAISRDEIPLQYQPYIQRYFEEVRKLKR